MASDSAPPLREWLSLPAVYHDVAAVIGWQQAVDFGMKVWQKKRCPSRDNTDPIHGGGYGFIYIPHRLTGNIGASLVAFAGEEMAWRLVKSFAGNILEFPSIVIASRQRRNAAVVAQLASGLRQEVVACLFDLSVRQVSRIQKATAPTKEQSHHVQ